MVLEYPVQIFILLIAALVIIALLINYYVQTGKICLIPPCTQTIEIKTESVAESPITANTIKKYCNICWEKSGEGGYKSDAVCYVVSGDYNPIAVTESHCLLQCNKAATSLIFKYDWVNKIVQVNC